jgi:LL-diaminopimelate aminotransferase
VRLNTNYGKLVDSYLFSAVSKKVESFRQSHPEADIISLGIGDVTLPLAKAVTSAMHNAVDELSGAATFKGYSPEAGYDFLRDAAQGYYALKGVDLDLCEIFISDGAKSDCGNILDIFGANNNVLIPNPVYPVYVDTNIMRGTNVRYSNGGVNNNFLPVPRDTDSSGAVDIIYLCSPNNPTGAVYDRLQLKQWVDYAIANQAIILFDAAYEAFVSDDNLPSSIYQIDGAKECAIEFCSFSKTAGFTGVRCGYTVVPQSLNFDGISVNKLWGRRQSTKFNGVSYITQKGAAAALSPEGLKQIKDNLRYYKNNASLIANTLTRLGVWYTGGTHSPYIWLKCPNNMKSWDFFDLLLQKTNVVGTPGEGFGANGEGFFRLTAFGNHENVAKAMQRIERMLS